MAIIYDTEVKVMSVSSFNTLALIHCPLQLRVLRGEAMIMITHESHISDIKSACILASLSIMLLYGMHLMLAAPR